MDLLETDAIEETQMTEKVERYAVITFCKRHNSKNIDEISQKEEIFHNSLHDLTLK